LSGFILDSQDVESVADIEQLGIASHATQTVMRTLDDRVQLARDCLEFVSRLSQSQQATTRLGE
jgi:LPPG:FO 2-phospho-L-lactate transferase